MNVMVALVAAGLVGASTFIGASFGPLGAICAAFGSSLGAILGVVS